MTTIFETDAPAIGRIGDRRGGTGADSGVLRADILGVAPSQVSQSHVLFD